MLDFINFLVYQYNNVACFRYFGCLVPKIQSGRRRIPPNQGRRSACIYVYYIIVLPYWCIDQYINQLTHWLINQCIYVFMYWLIHVHQSNYTPIHQSIHRCHWLMYWYINVSNVWDNCCMDTSTNWYVIH